MDDQLVRHYSIGDIGEAIRSALKATVGDSRPVTIEDLAPVDEFHIGGRRATAHLLQQLDLSARDHVLDIGAGIGGTARYVAQTYGCRVTGIELTPEYCRAAEMLSGMVGLDGRVTIQQGNALTMPFGDGSFDAAYMMHVGMNIEDKMSLFAEARRVLRPGGVLAIYDVLRGPGEGTFRFPVPWATDASTSFLSSSGEMGDALERAGFEVVQASDRTESALEFFQRLMEPRASGPPPVGLHLLMGPDARAKYGNMVANIKDGLCGPWEVIARRRDG